MIKRMCFLWASTILLTCVVAAQTPNPTRSYYNEEFKVGFRYPANFEFDNSKTAIDEESGFTILATASVPEQSYPHTNFSEANAQIEVGNVNEASCKELPANGESSKPHRKKVGNLTFYTIESSEGTGGSLYESEFYRVFNGGRCYQVGFVVHTSNVLAHQRDVRVVNTRIIFANFHTILSTMYFR